MDVTVRRTEPADCEALQRLFSSPRVIAGTLQVPFPRPRCAASASWSRRKGCSRW
jgi:hypothetical protein